MQEGCRLSSPASSKKRPADIDRAQCKAHPDAPLAETITPKGREVKTYGEVRLYAQHFARGIEELRLCEPVEVDKDKYKLMGYFLENSWLGPVMLAATEYLGSMANFLYTDPIDHFRYNVDHGMFETVLISTSFIDYMITPMEKKEIRVVKNFIVFKDVTPELVARMTALGITIYKFDDVIARGRDSTLVFEPITRDAKFLSVSTSGSTGTPKAAVVTDNSCFMQIAFEFGPWHEYIGDHPVLLNNVTLGFGTVLGLNVLVMCKGGKLVYLSQPMANMLEEFKAGDPTFVCLSPIAYNKIYQAIQQALDSLPSPKKEALKGVIAKKVAYYEATHNYKHPELDKVIAPFRDHFFGKNLKHMFNIGARLTNQVLNFFRAFLGEPVINIYGCVECTGITIMATENDDADCIGVPAPWYEIKLVDAPEKGYTVKDVVDGKPCPRGEIWVRGPTFIRYFNDPEKSAEVLTVDGWVRTGDVAALNEDYSLRIIDRTSHIIKLTCVSLLLCHTCSLSSFRWSTWRHSTRRANTWRRSAYMPTVPATSRPRWWFRVPTPSCDSPRERESRATWPRWSATRASRTKSSPISRELETIRRYTPTHECLLGAVL